MVGALGPGGMRAWAQADGVARGVAGETEIHWCGLSSPLTRWKQILMSFLANSAVTFRLNFPISNTDLRHYRKGVGALEPHLTRILMAGRCQQPGRWSDTQTSQAAIKAGGVTGASCHQPENI